MAGIIGDALLGGAGGLGLGMAQAGEVGMKSEAANEHARLIDQLTGARQERNAALHDQRARSMATEVTQPFQTRQQAERLTSEEGRTAMTASAHTEAAQIAADAAERRAQITRREQLQDAMKDLPASVKAYTTSLSDRLKALDRSEADPMIDQAGKDAIARRRDVLNSQLVEALTTKSIPKERPSPTPQPTGEKPPLSSFFGSAPKATAVAAGGPKIPAGPAKPSGQRIYGPLTPQSIIDNDVAAGVPEAIAYKNRREQAAIEKEANRLPADIMAP